MGWADGWDTQPDGSVLNRLTGEQVTAGQWDHIVKSHNSQARQGNQDAANEANAANPNKYYEASGVITDGSGRPISPLFESGRDANGNLMDKYKSHYDAVTGNREALDALKSRALAQGDSPWAKMMLQRQQMEQAQAGDQAAQANSAQLNNAKSMMAQSGGIGTGSRERLAKNSMVNGLLSQQQVNRQGQFDRQSIGLQDEQMKQGLLGQVQQGENQLSQFDAQQRQFGTQVQQTNNQNALNDLMAKRMFDSNAYNQQMQAWGADKTANAQAANAGSAKK